MSVLVLLFVVIVLQNTQVVDIRIVFWSLSMSRIILLLFSLVVGFVLGHSVQLRRRADHAFVRKGGD